MYGGMRMQGHCKFRSTLLHLVLGSCWPIGCFPKAFRFRFRLSLVKGLVIGPFPQGQISIMFQAASRGLKRDPMLCVSTLTVARRSMGQYSSMTKIMWKKFNHSPVICSRDILRSARGDEAGFSLGSGPGSGTFPSTADRNIAAGLPTSLR